MKVKESDHVKRKLGNRKTIAITRILQKEGTFYGAFGRLKITSLRKLIRSRNAHFSFGK